jgi:spermidine synthase
VPSQALEPAASSIADPRRVVRLTSLALFLAGAAAMGLEIVWFRFLISLLGAYRAVFSLLLAVILLGIWLGSLLGGWLQRRWGRPGLWFLVAQIGLVVSTLATLLIYDGSWIQGYSKQALEAFRQASSTGQTWIGIWTNLRIILWIVGLPAICMGCVFPLANAIAQQTAAVVGRRAGGLYLATTGGNICGSLLAGFALLPWFGVQISVSILVMIAAAASVPVALLQMRTAALEPARQVWRKRLAASLGVAMLAMGLFALQPTTRLLEKSFEFTVKGAKRTVVTSSEGINETLVVSEVRGAERRLHTNGHSMSSTNLFGQRYMRAFVHLPLLHLESPKRVLVICFGVGNTAHAASLHPTVERIEVADLSRNVLEHAHYFDLANHDILDNPLVRVYVNDGRHHLLMQPAGQYDLITLEPPPPGYAGVNALYSREFYQLAKSRLRPGGFVTQWLPGHLLDEGSSLAVVRTFLEEFPNAIMLNGFVTNQILMGRKDEPIELDVARVAKAMEEYPGLLLDLKHMRMASLVQLVGTYAASSETLARASRTAEIIEDDRPRLDYALHSKIRILRQVGALFDPHSVGDWCPSCLETRWAEGELADLPTYLDLMNGVYHDPLFLDNRHQPTRGQAPFAPSRTDPRARRVIAGSPYLELLFGKRAGHPTTWPNPDPP